MKEKYFKYIILFVLSIISIIFVYNDHFLYKTPILKVTSVENVVETENFNGEKYYVQNIKGVIKNGKYKGKHLTAENHFSDSLVYEDKIEKGMNLLVELSGSGKQVLNINSVKRDQYLVILLVIFIDLMILIAGKKGAQTLLSLFLNVLISAAAILMYSKHFVNINMLILYMIVSVLFIVVSLFVTNGKNKKTLAAIISSIVSLFVSFALSFILLKIYEEKLYLWVMDYIEAMHDYYYYLYVSVLLSGLGAIMDISITISSSLNELIMHNPKITKKALLKSGTNISKDVVGTMINVMLFTCYTSVIPTIVLAMRNNMSLANSLDFYGSLELTVVLCTCVSIILAIPISLLISIMILKKDKKVIK